MTAAASTAESDARPRKVRRNHRLVHRDLRLPRGRWLFGVAQAMRARPGMNSLRRTAPA